jgi:hypothetical protein
VTVSLRTRFVLIGALAGALLGATAAWAYTKAHEDRLPGAGQAGPRLRLQTGPAEYVKVGMALLTLVRQIADLLKPA